LTPIGAFLQANSVYDWGNKMEPPPDKDKKPPLSAAGWLALAILLGFFLVALWYAVKVWTAMSGVHMSGWGWTFLILGVVVTTALGAGLMALVFYSSRHDMDQ
jgi:hypothetical protein